MKILSFILSISMLINSIPCVSIYAGSEKEEYELNQAQSKQIPASPYVGTDDFKKLAQKGGLVDKTLFIKAIIDDSHEAILITRPRRWGKSLNMNMLKYFLQPELDASGQRVAPNSNRVLFNGGQYSFLETVEIEEKLVERKITKELPALTISKFQDFITDYQGQYPTILLSLKDVKEGTYQGFENQLRLKLSQVFGEYPYILNDLNKTFEDKSDLAKSLKAKSSLDKFISIYTSEARNATIEDLKDSLRFLSELLYNYHGKKTYILIDEYDTPLNKAYIQGYSEEALDVMRGLFGAALKTNKALEKGILTGILRITKADLFSGLNNFVEDSVLSTRYAQHYGFADQEVDSLLAAYQVLDRKAVKDWYNGYSIGGKTIYNPWSMMNYLSAIATNSQDALQPYWVDSGGTSLLKSALIKDDVQETLAQLRKGNTVSMLIKKDITLFNLQDDPDVLWPLLLYSGYLTAERVSFSGQGSDVEMRIPNTEVLSSFNTFMIDWIESKGVERISLDKIYLESLDDFKQKFLDLIQKVLPKIKLRNEAIFQALLTGRFLLVGSKDATHRLSSEEYAGVGRSDNIFYPLQAKSTTAVIHEYKYEKNRNPALLEDAWWQLYEKNYISATIGEKSIETVLMRPVVISTDPNVIIQAEETKHTLIEAQKIRDFFEREDVRETLKLNEKPRSISMKKEGRNNLLNKEKSPNFKELITRISRTFSWKKPSFNDNEPSRYQGIQEGQPIQFREHAIIADGDCGFHGLGIDRQHAVQQLLSTTDPEVRDMVADDMFEALIAHEFPVTGLDEALLQLQATYQRTALEADRLHLRASLLRPEVYQSFLKNYVRGNGWLSYVRGGRGILNALARLNRINVFVWTQDQKGQLKVVHSATQPHPQNTVHLLHTHGMTHFNLLEIDNSNRYGEEVEQRVHFLANAVVNNRVFFDDKWLAQRRHYLETGIIFETLRETLRQSTARSINESRGSVSLLHAHQKRQPPLGSGFYAFQKVLSGVRHLIFKK